MNKTTIERLHIDMLSTVVYGIYNGFHILTIEKPGMTKRGSNKMTTDGLSALYKEVLVCYEYYQSMFYNLATQIVVITWTIDYSQFSMRSLVFLIRMDNLLGNK